MSFTSRMLKKMGGQRESDPNVAPQSAYYSPPPTFPYQQPAPAQFTPPHVNLVPSTSSPPPVPPRQQSSPHQFTSVVPRAPQSLQPYDPPTQQGWLTNVSPPPNLRQQSPQPPSISPSIPSSSPLQSSTDATSMGEYPRQRSARREPPQVRKILSLDGGGVRGLSIITIVKYIMKNLNRERGFDLDPWEEFDMIGGTSTGG